jgi:hypothetical protein
MRLTACDLIGQAITDHWANLWRYGDQHGRLCEKAARAEEGWTASSQASAGPPGAPFQQEVACEIPRTFGRTVEVLMPCRTPSTRVSSVMTCTANPWIVWLAAPRTGRDAPTSPSTPQTRQEQAHINPTGHTHRAMTPRARAGGVFAAA